MAKIIKCFHCGEVLVKYQDKSVGQHTEPGGCLSVLKRDIKIRDYKINLLEDLVFKMETAK